MTIYLVTVFNAFLVFTVALLLKAGISHIQKMLEKIDGFESLIKTVKHDLRNEIRETITAMGVKLLKSEDAILEGLENVQDAVNKNTDIINRRKIEMIEIKKEQLEAYAEIERNRSANQKAYALLKDYYERLKKINSQIVKINHNLILLKGEKK